MARAFIHAEGHVDNVLQVFARDQVSPRHRTPAWQKRNWVLASLMSIIELGPSQHQYCVIVVAGVGHTTGLHWLGMQTQWNGLLQQLLQHDL